MAEGIPQIVAKCGSAGTHDDDPAQVQPMFRVGQEAGKQERSLARHWNTGVLAQQRQGYRPIAVVGDESTQEIEDGMPHEVSVAPVWVGHSCPTPLNFQALEDTCCSLKVRARFASHRRGQVTFAYNNWRTTGACELSAKINNNGVGQECPTHTTTVWLLGT